MIYLLILEKEEVGREGREREKAGDGETVMCERNID